jgi:DNA-binding XRE family transcriptional regulator
MEMDSKEFQALRKKLEKTQKQMGQLLGTSLKAIQSFEQGWRKVPPHVERQILFLQALKGGVSEEARRCWDIRGCPSQTRGACPAWEFNAGHLCWFINGTICQGKAQESWPQKMKVCRKCEVFSGYMKRA